MLGRRPTFFPSADGGVEDMDIASFGEREYAMPPGAARIKTSTWRYSAFEALTARILLGHAIEFSVRAEVLGNGSPVVRTLPTRLMGRHALASYGKV